MSKFYAPKGDARIKIDGEILTINEVYTTGYDLPMIDTDCGEFYVAKDSEQAGKAARRRWEEMAESDPSEFRCMIGDETLIAWAMGDWGGPGNTQVRSLTKWLDLWLDAPNEEFASYDSEERTVERCGYLQNELGFTPTVAYRSS